MSVDGLVLQLSIIIIGAAVLGTLFISARQPIIIAYIAVGIAVGPSGVDGFENTEQIENISHFGVILLLFLIGLYLQPAKLLSLF